MGGSSTHARIIVSRSFPPAHPSHKTHAPCKVQIETIARGKVFMKGCDKHAYVSHYVHTITVGDGTETKEQQIAKRIWSLPVETVLTMSVKILFQPRVTF